MLLVFPRLAAPAAARTRRRSFPSRSLPLVPPVLPAAAVGTAMSVHQWMQRHVNDPYVKASRKQDLRSRAAFKLKEMQEKHKILHRGDCVIDLGCSPGGWSEVAAKLVLLKAAPASSSLLSAGSDSKPTATQARAAGAADPSRPAAAAAAAAPASPSKGGLVIGIDIRSMLPLPGVMFLQGDFTDAGTQAALRQALENGEEEEEEEGEGKEGGRRIGVDVILSDMAPDLSGDKFRDHRRTLDLGYEVLAFADDVFRGPSSSTTSSSSPTSSARRRKSNKKTVLIKLFKGRDEEEFMTHARARYNEVRLLKPKASRSESGEQYLLARGFKGVGGGGSEGDW